MKSQSAVNVKSIEQSKLEVSSNSLERIFKKYCNEFTEKRGMEYILTIPYDSLLNYNSYTEKSKKLSLDDCIISFRTALSCHGVEVIETFFRLDHREVIFFCVESKTGLLYNYLSLYDALVNVTRYLNQLKIGEVKIEFSLPLLQNSYDINLFVKDDLEKEDILSGLEEKKFIIQLFLEDQSDSQLEYELLKQFCINWFPQISDDLKLLDQAILENWIDFKSSRHADDEILFYQRFYALMDIWDNREKFLKYPTFGATNIRFSAKIEVYFLKAMKSNIIKTSQKSISYGSYIRKLQSFFRSHWCEFSSVHLEESDFGGDQFVIVWETNQPILFQNILDYPNLVLSFLLQLENPQISIEVMLNEIESEVETGNKLSKEMSMDYSELSFIKSDNSKLNNQKRIVLGKNEKILPLPY